MTHILTVDDSVSMRQMVAYTLRDAGFDVSEAGDGTEALAAAEQQSFDLVLADVNMPNMDGIALIKALRGLSSYQYTPLLMLTTESSMERKSEGKAAGATGWIVKPFEPENLVATVRRVLG
ncbi:response regulator [Algiphilus sp.]|uniref:response regulator n=1 Tax=Algiphilus sp. TaxID=1872431 RepID=UPI0025BCADFB|nr:response regulator [Algiphilus sp.]MCK5771041.1 response regulator [Algiphilus sp.]